MRLYMKIYLRMIQIKVRYAEFETFLPFVNIVDVENGQ